jgi:sugar/nucleoside kinase (ribokinase family)
MYFPCFSRDYYNDAISKREIYMPDEDKMTMADGSVYVYGMTVLSTIHQLKGKFPSADGYREIQQTFVMPGGEAANGAVVLRNLGVPVMLDGCFLGDLTAEPLRKYLNDRNVDCSLLHHQAGFPGWRDIVFCDGDTRTVFGWFVDYLFGGRRLWSRPSDKAIQSAKCIALDPFFGSESEEVARLCQKNHRDYVTIDSRLDTLIVQRARVVVCSQEFLDREYPGTEFEALLKQYQMNCAGLVIFTFGSRPILYGSAGTALRTFQPYSITVVDTLGAGDTFRAGVVYGVLNGWPDKELVRFASACAAVSCLRFPSVLHPPSLTEVTDLMNSRPD